MKQTVIELKKQGYHPLEVPGGGHMPIASAALAYAVVDEVVKQWGNNAPPEWVVLASGTGTTQAGILAGIQMAGWCSHVVGVSVARKNPRGTDVVKEAYHEVCDYLDIDNPKLNVDFRDDWVGRGYGCGDDNLYSVIEMAARTEGLILDPTYTGKAFYGLIKLVERGEIAKGARVLFWHTGGLLNLLASDWVWRCTA